jgi:hypothetical protein
MKVRCKRLKVSALGYNRLNHSKMTPTGVLKTALCQRITLFAAN